MTEESIDVGSWRRNAQGTCSTRRKSSSSPKGVVGITTRKVAERAGVNQALVHYHFGTIEELLVAALERVSVQVKERSQEIYRDTTRSFMDGWFEEMEAMITTDFERGWGKVWLENLTLAANRPKIRKQYVKASTMTRKLHERQVSEMLEQHGVDADEYPRPGHRHAPGCHHLETHSRPAGRHQGGAQGVAGHVAPHLGARLDRAAPAARDRAGRRPDGAGQCGARAKEEGDGVSESVMPWIVDAYVNANPPHLGLTWSLTDDTYGAARTESQDLGNSWTTWTATTSPELSSPRLRSPPWETRWPGTAGHSMPCSSTPTASA